MINYRRMAEAIVIQGVRDYQSALRQKEKNENKLYAVTKQIDKMPNAEQFKKDAEIQPLLMSKDNFLLLIADEKERVWAKKYITYYFRIEKCNKTIKDCETFLNSEWFSFLSGLNGNLLENEIKTVWAKKYSDKKTTYHARAKKSDHQ